MVDRLYMNLYFCELKMWSLYRDFCQFFKYYFSYERNEYKLTYHLIVYDFYEIFRLFFRRYYNSNAHIPTSITIQFSVSNKRLNALKSNL